MSALVAQSAAGCQYLGEKYRCLPETGFEAAVPFGIGFLLLAIGLAGYVLSRGPR